MNIQRVLLRVMLASLAVAAAVGALAALTNETETFWRIIGTCALTSVAAGLLIPLSRHLDKDRSRPAALTGVAAIVVEFIVILALIWRVLDALGQRGEPYEMATVFVPVALAAAIFVYLLGAASTKWAGICGLTLDAVVFVAANIAIWSTPWNVAQKYGEVAGIIAIFSAMIVICLLGSGSGDRRWWRWIGIVTAVGAITANIYTVWNDVPNLERFLALLDSVPALCALANLLLLASLQGSQVWARRIALSAATITAVCTDLEFYIANDSGAISHDDPLARVAAAGGIITGCAAVGVAILVALNRKSKPKPIATDAIRDITVICPLCQKKNVLLIDTPGQCACGLKMTITIEEPHCSECGYLLIGLTSDRCPECGTAIHPAAPVQGSST